MAAPPSPAGAALLLVLVFLPAVLATTPAGPHIADLNVLLPPRMTNPLSYRLLGTGGCFAWSWDHHDVLSVQPEFNDSSRCSTSARLMSIAPYSRRKETAVYATDLQSGITIRCKVFIDEISRIQIFHHAVKIDLDELATLRIRAFDDEENVFSSVVGLQFLWKLEPMSLETDNARHLVHVPLKETPLSDCGGFCGDLDTQIELEDKGLGSDLYVVQGIGIGHEVVTAQLLEPQLEHVADKIILTVVEAMSLDPPSPVFVTIGALIYYSLRVIRRNTPKAVELPSSHHRWSALNSSVAQVDSLMGIAYAVNLGITSIIVEDTRLSGHVQTSSMHVVIPDKLSLHIVPVVNSLVPLEGTKLYSSSAIWYVYPGQEYVIYMKVFSQGPDVNVIYITENNDLKLESSTLKYWDLFSVSDDLAVTYDSRISRLLKPISEGQGTLAASLTYCSGDKERAEVLKVVQEVTVCAKVKFIIGVEDESSQIIRLPWAPGVYQEFELKAKGGCGRTLEDYIWFSSDETIVSVSSSGVVRAKRPGQAIIKVASILDLINFDEVVIEVSVPSTMIMLSNFPVEAVIGTQLAAGVTLKSSSGNSFNRCDAFNPIVRWKVISEMENFKISNTTAMLPQGFDLLNGRLCAWTYLYASSVGRAMLHATFSTELQSSFHSIDEQISLKAASSIASYSPLVAYQAESGNQVGGYSVDLSRIHTGILGKDYACLDELYLVPGSGMGVLLLGGPERWDQSVEYIETVDVIAEQDLAAINGLFVHRASSSGGRLYTVTCQKLGNFVLLFSRGNLIGNGHPVPAVAKLELPVICSFPSSIVLISNEPENTPDIIEAAINAERGPNRIRTAPIVVANGCSIRIAAIGIHTDKRAFANSSSLSLRWELSGCEELAHWNDSDNIQLSLGHTWERFMVLHDVSGLCTIHATVIDATETRSSQLFEEGALLLGSSENTLTDTIQLQLVSTLRVMPESILLVFDPEAKAELSIVGGTCFLDAITNDTEVVHVSQPPESAECLSLLLSVRGLGTALVTIRDIGLSPPAAASALVRVANVDWIEIVSPDMISLMEGTTKSFGILAGIQDGCIFDSSQYPYMNMHAHLEDNTLELVNGSSRFGGWIIPGPKFSVRAANLGVTTLFVSIKQRSGNEILSQIVNVEVYKPLQVHPEYIYLAPGASYVLTVKGGPKVGSFVEYTSVHEEIAEVQGSSGRLSALSIGNATVRAAVFGNDGTLICEAYGKVQVGIPSAMILNSQSGQLCIGCKMPIFPSIPEGNLFSFYKVCKDYRWTVENVKVLSFQTTTSLHPDMLSSAEGNKTYNSDSINGGFIEVLFGRSAGRTKVSVSLSCDFVSSGTAQSISYIASETLTVVSDPSLALGIPITWIFPPFYTTSDLLPGSSHSYGKFHASEPKDGTSYSVLKACGNSDPSKLDAVAIDGHKIRTRESNQIACIQAKDQTTRRTEIASCVRVAEVAQVRVSTPESSFHAAHLAMHAKLELVVNFCDGLGYPFYEAQDVVPLDIETNYPDVLSIIMPRSENKTAGSRGSVFLKAESPGRALVMITINHDPKKADFIMVSVGAQLYPQNPVIHVGHHLNFTVVGDGLDGYRAGQWLSSNESILSVNRFSGEAHALDEGAVQVIFEGSNLKLQTTVGVMKVDQVIVDAPADTLTNVPFHKGYKFPVKLSHSYIFKFETSSAIKFSYDCKADPPSIGYVKPWIDFRNGHSYCLFFPYSPKHLLDSMSQSQATRSEDSSSSGQVMYVSIIASLREAPHVQGFAHALYIGGFSVEEQEKLNLTPASNCSVITIMGNTDVEIHWNSKDLLQVVPLRRDDFGIVGLAQYEVKVLKDRSFTDKLFILLPATGQKTEIDVSYEHGEKTTTAGLTRKMWRDVVICVVLMISTFVVLLKMICTLDPEGRPAPTVRRSTPASHATVADPPVTPDRNTSATAGSIHSSPHTPPQPFMEYVRRTIDETPYYKRNGRRRFDPQYTY